MSGKHGQDDLLKFRMGQNGEFTTECGMVVGARWDGMGFSEPTGIFLHNLWGLQRSKVSKCYFSGQKYNLSARSQTRMSRPEDNNNSNDHLLYLHYACLGVQCSGVEVIQMQVVSMRD